MILLLVLTVTSCALTGFWICHLKTLPHVDAAAGERGWDPISNIVIPVVEWLDAIVIMVYAVLTVWSFGPAAQQNGLALVQLAPGERAAYPSEDGEWGDKRAGLLLREGNSKLTV